MLPYLVHFVLIWKPSSYNGKTVSTAALLIAIVFPHHRYYRSMPQCTFALYTTIFNTSLNLNLSSGYNVLCDIHHYDMMLHV